MKLHKFLWALLFFVSFAQAQNVSEIIVKNNKRIESDAILSKLSLKVGNEFSREAVANDIKALYQMGYFDDIIVSVEGSKVIYEVKERPQIWELEYKGMDALSQDDIKEAIQLKKHDIYDIAKVQKDVEKITKLYEDKGYFLVRINTRIEQTEEYKKENRVKLVFDINEGEQVRIKKISFLNNHVFNDKEIKTIMMSTEGGYFAGGFSSTTSNFKESIFRDDLERIKWLYSNEGYVRFEYEAPTITLSEDRRWVYITVNMNEGKQYHTGEIHFEGDDLFSRDKLTDDTKLRSGDVFSQGVVRQDIATIQDLYGDQGYAFANIIPRPKIDDEKLIVDLTYQLDRGPLVHFGKFTISGNSTTRDKVIRRELLILEGELYHGTKLRKSREAVERLGFFEQGVVFNTVSPPGQPHVLDVEIQVKERRTGTFTIGAGYGSKSKLMFNSNISHNNLFGRGHQIELSAQLSFAKKGDREFRLSFEEPYLFDTKWSFGTSAYQRLTNYPGRYRGEAVGWTLSTGHPVAEYTRAYIEYDWEKNRYKSVDDPSYYESDVRRTEEGITSSGTLSLVRDTRSNRYEPRDGTFFRSYNEYGGIFGDKYFDKAGATFAWYTTPFWDLTFRNRYEYGAAFRVNDNYQIPSYKLFQPVGPNAIRGYENNIGVLVRDKNGNYGYYPGNYQLFTNFEMEFPLIREAGLKAVIFADAGNAFESNPFSRLNEFKYNWGLGFRWFSPIGPLRFEWGIPVGSAEDKSEGTKFWFMIGPPF